MTRRKWVVVACAIGVLLFALAYMLPSTVGKAFEMDEGAVNAYAARVFDGAVPHRDFLTFYGPGNLWLVARRVRGIRRERGRRARGGAPVSDCSSSCRCS